MINIGYACVTLGLKDAKLQTCRLKNASDKRIQEIIEHNLNAMENVIEYNHKNNIRLFRISSEIIPFASHPDVSIKWCEVFKDRLNEIGGKIKDYKIRVSMHPGQYTVLNSPNTDVVERSKDDLKYHCYFLDCLGVDESSKVIFHIGGIYGDKNSATERFISNYITLEKSIKKRLVIENDDKNYNIEDVLYISKKLYIPVVFDNLHNQINKPQTNKNINDYIVECSSTWKEGDGRQKIHYSQQDIKKAKGAHSKTITVNKFLDFYKNLPSVDLDIMLEVKDKNLSAIKCILSTAKKYNIALIENEWAKYKYYVLGKNPNGYLSIRQLLKDKKNNITNEFYDIVEQSIGFESKTNQEVNALQHVLGYFGKVASSSEKARIVKSIEKYKNGDTGLINVKTSLERLAYKYKIDYLINSYYFIDV